MLLSITELNTMVTDNEPTGAGTSNTLGPHEADSVSASQSVCKGHNPSGSGTLAPFGHPSHEHTRLNEKGFTSRDKPTQDDLSIDDLDHQANPLSRRQLTSTWTPCIAVVFPTLLLPAALIGLVFGYQINPGTNLFPISSDTATEHRGYYLVTLSVTRLAIISSCASTLAPFLTAPILILWRIHAIRSAKKALGVHGSGHVELATLPQLSTLLGLLVGSFDELLKYLFRSCARLSPTPASKKRSPSMSRPVHLAALVVIACVFITLSMWTADTVFHTLSDSTIIEKFDSSAATLLSFGYSPTQRCQHFDRSNNYCLPCTVDLSEEVSQLEFNARANEIFRLGANVSEISQIQSIATNLSILLPRTERISNRTDYRARTLGVAAKCKPITDVCNMRQLDIQTYTMFNCSNRFRGVIGEAPVVPTTQNFTILDPDTPALDFKPSAYLQYGFYETSNLSEPYNSVGYNVSVNAWAVSAGAASTNPCPSDESLPPTAHVGVAGRFSVTSGKAGVDLQADRGLFSTSIYSDFVFNCALEALEVEYVWASGAVRNYTVGPADVSLLNMYIGQLPYYKQATTDDMSDDILQMALQADSQSMADTWAKLFSVRVLSVIGGYTEASLNLEQQNRVQVLVARVHMGSMWFLVGCSLSTALFVAWITLRGLWIIEADPEIGVQAVTFTYDGQLNHLLKPVHANASGKKTMDEKIEIVAEKDACSPAPPERTFTGNSAATTVVPESSVA